jgi:hypothetical protein
MLSLGLLLLLQQPAQQQAQQLPPSPIQKVTITPAIRSMTAGDTMRITATALGADGKPVEGASIRYFASGGRFEGRIDSTGLVYAGSTGTLGITAMASVAGTRPVIERIEIGMNPGAAARLTLAPSSTKLVVGQSMLVNAQVFSASGDARADAIRWRSSASRVASVSQEGLVKGVSPGKATLTAKVDGVEKTVAVEVIANTIASLELTPATSTAKQGDVVQFKVTARDRAGKAIAGLSPTFTFSPGEGAIDNTGQFVGYEAGKYVVTATVANHSAQAVVSLSWRDVRRPAKVVGRLPRTLFSTEEVWLHPNGKNAYLGTGGGGDRLYALDISDPANPVVTDSLVANTRRVNDVMTTPDGKFLVHTREGASDRKNGIVIASLEDPAHPKVISEFTEGVTGGVHSAFIYQQAKYGTHIYLTNDGTGYMHVIDINDPYHPKEASRWTTRPDQMGNALHDIDVQDGLAYLSYWNEGLVIVDIGNGIKGGSPSNPQLVSQFKYDLNDLYRDVEASGGKGFIRGTHTAWRHGKYVFIADEVFPASGVTGAKDAAAFRAYGNLQVVDVSDYANPKSVAWYKPEFGGVHNVWVAGDTLYMGAYNAGFRAFDISGELKGDLRAQGREIVHVNTADMSGKTQNAAMTWGVVVRDGLAYVNDINNGLWIIQMEPKRENLTP